MCSDGAATRNSLPNGDKPMIGYIIVGLVCLFGGGALGYLIGGKVKAAAIAAGTAVPAGIDLFDPGLMYHYFHDYCDEVGIHFDQLMALGRNPRSHDDRFSMAILALNTSAPRNAVSRLHRHVSQEMWSELWPDLPSWEVPITSITTGTHLPSWLNGDLAALYDQYLQPDWRERFAEPEIWEQVRDIPDEEVTEAHRRRKRRLVSFVRARQQASAMRRQASAAEIRRASEVLDPNAFTIGF